ncbi:UDP-glycosyltransferase 85A4, partial [Mucuna pruriens]
MNCSQGHITPMLKLAKASPFEGVSHHSLNGFLSFRFETIPDGLPHRIHLPSEPLCQTCPSCYIVSDDAMSFTLIAAQELKIPVVLLWTISASALMCTFTMSLVHVLE